MAVPERVLPEQTRTGKLQERRDRGHKGAALPLDGRSSGSQVFLFLSSFYLFYNKYGAFCKKKHASCVIKGESIDIGLNGA